MDILQLQLKRRSRDNNKTPRTYYDFMVNGRSLMDILKLGDRISVLVQNNWNWNKEVAKQLLLKKTSELPSGRVPIYICPECGDLGCGAVTVKIIEDGMFFIWSNFGVETYHTSDLIKQYDVGPYRFNKIDYSDSLNLYIGKWFY
jgi:hypothetical protein